MDLFFSVAVCQIFVRKPSQHHFRRSIKSKETTEFRDMTTRSLKKTRGSCPTPTFSIHKNENSKFKATCVCLKLCDIQMPFCSLCECAQRKSRVPLKTQWLLSQDDFVLLTHITPPVSSRCLQISITEMCFLTYRDVSKEARFLYVHVSSLVWVEGSRD